MNDSVLHTPGGASRRPARRPLPNWHATHRESLTPGELAADRLRDWMRSWTFIAIFIGLMTAWMLLNAAVTGWDPYPFILLNLFLSMLAGLQGAILLIAAKRQDALSAALAQHDFDTDVAAKREIEELMRLNHELLAILDARARMEPSAEGPSSHDDA